jgi:hypothetical protein
MTWLLRPLICSALSFVVSLQIFIKGPSSPFFLSDEL